jgi:hypothetical protein
MLKQKLSLIEDFHKRKNPFTRWMTKGIVNFERFKQIQRATTATPQSTAASSEMQLSTAIGSSGSIMMNNNLNSSSSTTASLFSSPLLVAAAAAQQLQQQQIQNQLLLLSLNSMKINCIPKIK